MPAWMAARCTMSENLVERATTPFSKATCYAATPLEVTAALWRFMPGLLQRQPVLRNSAFVDNQAGGWAERFIWITGSKTLRNSGTLPFLAILQSTVLRSTSTLAGSTFSTACQRSPGGLYNAHGYLSLNRVLFDESSVTTQSFTRDPGRRQIRISRGGLPG
jgi:hypothetical protein